jgi:hypothetical protein
MKVNQTISWLCQYLNISSTSVEEHAFTSLIRRSIKRVASSVNTLTLVLPPYVKVLTEEANRFIDLDVRDVKACSSTEVELMLSY